MTVVDERTDASDDTPPPPSEADRARLEAEVERLALADAERQAARGVQSPFRANLAALQQALAEKQATDPEPMLAEQATASYGEVWADLREHQAAVRMRAWHNDLAAAHQQALAAWTLDRLDEDQHPKWLRRFVECIGQPGKPLNLVLHGQVGPGKTSAAIAAGNLAASCGRTVRFVKHSAYVLWLRSKETWPEGLTGPQIRARYRNCDLLILDDLGAGLDLDKEASRHVEAETEDLVGDRLTAGRTTIFTTNLVKDDLVRILGPRTMSRVSGGAVTREFTGPDRRKPATW